MIGEQSWDPNFYKEGYEGYESFANFPDQEALDRYRSLLLRKTDLQTAFIRRHFDGRKVRVLDIGAGNGRLLVSLAQNGLLEWGLGVEIAKSRVEFARRWVTDLGLDNVEMKCADVLACDFSAYESFDLAVCITGAFGYFRPIRASAPSELLALMKRGLEPSGSTLLEVYKLTYERRQMLNLTHGKLKTWHVLPPEDRFAYYLDDYEYFPEQNILRHGKICIGRDGSIDAGRFEVLAYYTATELADQLRNAGFPNAEIFGDFEDGRYDEATSSQIVVLARSEGTP